MFAKNPRKSGLKLEDFLLKFKGERDVDTSKYPREVKVRKARRRVDAAAKEEHRRNVIAISKARIFMACGLLMGPNGEPLNADGTPFVNNEAAQYHGPRPDPPNSAG